MIKEKFPGLNNMTVEEVRVMAKVCQDSGDDANTTLEYINCIDDCLTILKSAALINRRRGNQIRRVTAKNVIEARILAADI